MSDNSKSKCNVSLKYLKFLVVKRLEQMLWDEFVETLLQGEELGLNASHEPPVDVQPERDAINHQRNIMEPGEYYQSNSLSVKSLLFIRRLSFNKIF